jgi:hypothetical protein
VTNARLRPGNRHRLFGCGNAGRELKGLRVYLAEGDTPPVEVPPSPRKFWTRKGIAEWLVERLAEDAPTLVGIDHGFSFPLRYFEVHALLPDWPAFLDDFQRHLPTDEDHTYVEFVRRGIHGNGAARVDNARWRRLTDERARCEIGLPFRIGRAWLDPNAQTRFRTSHPQQLSAGSSGLPRAPELRTHLCDVDIRWRHQPSLRADCPAIRNGGPRRRQCPSARLGALAAASPFRKPAISPSCGRTSGKFAACLLQACGSDSTADTTCQPASRAPSQNPPTPQKSEIALMVTRRRSRTCDRAF